MRGRKPRTLTVADADTSVLQAVARSRRLAWFQVQHARIVLSVAAGEPIQAIASRLECDRATVWRVCRRSEHGGLKDLLLDDSRVGRPQEISPLQRAQVVELACLEPVAEGLHITHWTSEDLARRAVADGIVDAISPRTVQRILHDVDLQPHPLLENCSARRSVQGAGRESALVLRKCGKTGSPGHLDRSR